MHELSGIDCYYNRAGRVILSVSIRWGGGGVQDSRTFFSNPSRKLDVTSGPKSEDFLLRMAEKNFHVRVAFFLLIKY